MGGATGRPLYLEFYVKILTMTARYGTILFFVNILRLARHGRCRAEKVG
ncbi:MAG: hypothetical protein ABGW95_04265 [Candidatus Poseidoniia archaeon]